MKTKITNIGAITTWSPEKNNIQTLDNVEIMVENYKITEISSKIIDVDHEINAEGALIIPGFVDSHTHPIFSGNRSDEFALRIKGESYEKIAAGASLLQLYTGLIYKGPSVAKEIKKELIQILKAEGINNIKDAIGIGIN